MTGLNGNIETREKLHKHDEELTNELALITIDMIDRLIMLADRYGYDRESIVQMGYYIIGQSLPKVNMERYRTSIQRVVGKQVL